ncbi:hypothetical protein [Candidatus Methanosphaera massiliense]|jgi:hypothetical protein|uniref:hypothetical protein n=1 Tax=Methanosphaera TaxID=2316 RepID=UPI0023805DC9|nr:hypothetical protein [Candidatus Methanosphaera massiliense]MDD6285230.1 hypothetical protein [Methanobacteriaceae archaeon]MDE4078548.1 hypothetical protein [Candidatus Methanosphaera massiliense]MDY2745292.1 hypothetical protein [Methanosphaera sp.]
MTKWNYEKLDKMTKEGSKFSKLTLNYRVIADNFQEIMIKTRQNGDVLPLEFEDVFIAYENKNPIDDMVLPEISKELEEKISEKENNQKIMHIKHFSRNISHQQWFDFIDQEVLDFVEKYPEFSDIILDN